MKKKKLSIGRYKRKLWTLYSEYIRRKDANADGCTNCVTCGKYLHWTELQAGHFLAGRSNGILFVEGNTFPQCVGCNVFKHGNLEEFYPYMLKTFGDEKIQELKRLKRTTVKLDSTWYEEKIKDYDDKLGALEKK